MDARKVFRTPSVAEQVLLLIIEKKKISRKSLIEIICTEPEKIHAINNALWRLKKNGQIKTSGGIYEFIGPIPEKKKFDQIWDALRHSPSLTINELVCLTDASKKTVRTYIRGLTKTGFVKAIGYSWQPTRDGPRRMAHYTLIDKDKERPRWSKSQESKS